MVTLTRRIDRNWFDGRIGNRKGIFPVSYVDVICEPGSTRGESIELHENAGFPKWLK